MAEVHPASLAYFVRSIAVLALSANEQLAFLAITGTPDVLDELALEFDAGRLLVTQFEELGWVTAAFRTQVQSLDALLDSMSGEDRADLWIPPALENAPEWAGVRLLARDLLFSI